MSEHYSATEVARALNLSRGTVYRFLKRGTLHARRNGPGCKWKVTPAGLAAIRRDPYIARLMTWTGYCKNPKRPVARYWPRKRG